MPVLLIRERATPEQVAEMLKALKSRIKVAVDIEREILAGGGTLHADGEDVLLKDGSRQQHIWGADWYPDTKEIRYEALINMRVRDNNPSMEIQNHGIREQVERVIRRLLG